MKLVTDFLRLKRLYIIPALILFFPFLEVETFSQQDIRGTIVEHSSGLPIAFATITYKQNSVINGVISDVQGKFRIYESGITRLNVTCIGYRPSSIKIDTSTPKQNLVIELDTDTLGLGEVIVTPAMNPAIRIIRNVIKKKDENNFLNYDKYSYKCYLKTLMNLKISMTSTDSADRKAQEKINRKANFISESVFLVSSVSKRTENRLLAVKTSGFSDPMFGQNFVSSFHNAISFYNNTIPLFAIQASTDRTSLEYLSPLSDASIRSYYFTIEDTIISAIDSTYIIDFHPVKGSNFNGLRGKLFISTNGYAIKNIIAEPSEKGLIGFKFRQDYEFINGRWFPTALDEEIGFTSMKVSKKINAVPVYLITSRISDVDYEPEITFDSINREKTYLDPVSLKESEAILDRSRPVLLTGAEQNAYSFLDSIGRKYRFDYWAELYPSLASGKIPVKFIDIDLLQMYTSNKFEGSRIGLGISTNEKFSEIVSIGGFAGYGLKDKEPKYGANITFHLEPSAEADLNLSFQDNLKEPGFEYESSLNLLSTSGYARQYLGYRMDNFREKKAAFSFRSGKYLKIYSSVSFRDIMPQYDYSYKNTPLTSFQADELTIRARYSFGETLQSFGSMEMILNSGNPVLDFTYKRGVDIFDRDSYNYNRYEATLDFTVYKGKIGQTTLRVAGGYIDKPLPYSLLFTGEGSKSTYPIVIANTFQAMKPYEFLSDRYVSLFWTHNFGTLLFERPRFKPRFIITQNSSWGTLRNGDDHGIDFMVKDKIYNESGLLINNLIRLKLLNIYYLGFGGGAFYRWGYYANESFTNNLAMKISITLSFE